MQIQFYPIDITYKIINDKTAILIFGRTAKGEQVCVLDDSFLPYFWAIAKKGESEEALARRIQATTTDYRGIPISVLGTEVQKKKFLGRDVIAIKIYTRFPKSVATLRGKIREMPGVEEVLEADIPFINRYLIDKKIIPLTLTTVEGEAVTLRSRVPVVKATKIEQTEEVTLKEPRILSFDIETYSPAKGRILAKENPILMIGFYGKNFKKVITWKRFKTDKDYIEFVNSEADLIAKFKEVINEYKPDILVGYFSDGFDMPYIRLRAEKYKINLDISLDYSSISAERGKTSRTRITGITHLDIFAFISRVFARTLETDSYDLNSVAAELLGKKKKEVDLSTLIDTWDNNPQELEKFCEYNLQDAILTYELTRKVFPNIKEFVKIVGIPIFDASRMSFSRLVEWYTIRQSPNFNELCPNKPMHDDIKARRMATFKGGFVFEPKPGLYKDIVVCDFRSLYAAIVISHNISPAALNCSCCEGEAEKIPVEGEQYWFCKKRKGVIPTLVADLVARRMRVKEIMAKTDKKDKKYILLDARQDALKILGNAFWGYYGFFGARWYSLECAKSITTLGRRYLRQVIDTAQKNSFNVIYGDTDGIFFTLGNKTMDDVKNFVDKINMSLSDIMELELRGKYPRGIFVSARSSHYGAKKKYALLDENNEIKIKGFATVRRDWSFIAKDTQEEVLNIILKENDPEKALEYTRKVMDDLRNKNIPLAKVVIHTQLQKELDEYEQIGPHVAVARKLFAKGFPIGAGSLITYVIKEGREMIRDRAATPDECTEKDYDTNYYINNQVIPAVERIFNVLGYKKEDLLEHKEQRKLHKFFD